MDREAWMRLRARRGWNRGIRLAALAWLLISLHGGRADGIIDSGHGSVPIGPPAKEATGDSTAKALGLVERALAAFEACSNFTAAVDIDFVDKRGPASTLTRSKETWSFHREHGTNRFTRTRYSPFPGKEVVVSRSFAGGQMVAQKAIPLPENFSLPGFEPYGLLSEMRNARPTVEAAGPAETLLAASTPSNGILRAWFPAKAILPRRIERWTGLSLAFVYVRIASDNPPRLLPSNDNQETREHGRVTSTLSRFFSKVQEDENAAPASETQSKSDSKP